MRKTKTFFEQIPLADVKKALDELRRKQEITDLNLHDLNLHDQGLDDRKPNAKASVLPSPLAAHHFRYSAATRK